MAFLSSERTVSQQGPLWPVARLIGQSSMQSVQRACWCTVVGQRHLYKVREATASVSPATEDGDRVLTAEAESIGHDSRDRHVTRGMRYVVEVTARIRIVQVDR